MLATIVRLTRRSGKRFPLPLPPSDPPSSPLYLDQHFSSLRRTNPTVRMHPRMQELKETLVREEDPARRKKGILQHAVDAVKNTRHLPLLLLSNSKKPARPLVSSAALSSSSSSSIFGSDIPLPSPGLTGALPRAPAPYSGDHPLAVKRGRKKGGSIGKEKRVLLAPTSRVARKGKAVVARMRPAAVMVKVEEMMRAVAEEKGSKTKLLDYFAGPKEAEDHYLKEWAKKPVRRVDARASLSPSPSLTSTKPKQRFASHLEKYRSNSTKKQQVVSAFRLEEEKVATVPSPKPLVTPDLSLFFPSSASSARSTALPAAPRVQAPTSSPQLGRTTDEDLDRAFERNWATPGRSVDLPPHTTKPKAPSPPVDIARLVSQIANAPETITPIRAQAIPVSQPAPFSRLSSLAASCTVPSLPLPPTSTANAVGLRKPVYRLTSVGQGRLGVPVRSVGLDADEKGEEIREEEKEEGREEGVEWRAVWREGQEGEKAKEVEKKVTTVPLEPIARVSALSVTSPVAVVPPTVTSPVLSRPVDPAWAPYGASHLCLSVYEESSLAVAFYRDWTFLERQAMLTANRLTHSRLNLYRSPSNIPLTPVELKKRQAYEDVALRDLYRKREEALLLVDIERLNEIGSALDNHIRTIELGAVPQSHIVDALSRLERQWKGLFRSPQKKDEILNRNLSGLIDLLPPSHSVAETVPLFSDTVCDHSYAISGERFVKQYRGQWATKGGAERLRKVKERKARVVEGLVWRVRDVVARGRMARA
ncbi:hypothetical protein JCM8547_004145 [Rhodosporidiobolus lusitaniae]